MTEPYIHPAALVDPRVIIGAGTKIWCFCHLQSGAEIGCNCTLGQNVNVSGLARIGDGVKIQNNVSIYDGVILQDAVSCGPSCVFFNDLTPRARFPKEKRVYTLVKEGASIGANATVLCGHTIGAYALIGAGAVVTSDVPDYALMTGVPARQAGWVCQCGNILPDTLCCEACGRTYEKGSAGLKEEDA